MRADVPQSVPYDGVRRVRADVGIGPCDEVRRVRADVPQSVPYGGVRRVRADVPQSVPYGGVRRVRADVGIGPYDGTQNTFFVCGADRYEIGSWGAVFVFRQAEIFAGGHVT